MALSTAFSTDLVKLILSGTAIANIADNASASPLTNLYFSLHTANPGAGGTQATSEVAYTGYARVAVARVAGSWAFTGINASPNSSILFPECTAGASSTATWVGVGVAATGGAKLLLRGQITSPAGGIVIAPGVTPYLKTGTVIKFLDA